MTALILIAIDLVAMAALVFGLYFPRTAALTWSQPSSV